MLVIALLAMVRDAAESHVTTAVILFANRSKARGCSEISVATPRRDESRERLRLLLPVGFANTQKEHPWSGAYTGGGGGGGFTVANEPP